MARGGQRPPFAGGIAPAFAAPGLRASPARAAGGSMPPAARPPLRWHTLALHRRITANAVMDGPINSSVRRRRVFFIPGYDPFPPTRYRELYRAEAARQAAISGYQLAINRHDRTIPGFGWDIDAQIEEARVRARLTVLVWGDLVKASMRPGLMAVWALMLRTLVIFLGTGALRAMYRLRRAPVLAGLYPVVVLNLQLLVAALVAGVIWWGARAALGATLGTALGAGVAGAGGGAGWLAVIPGALAGWMVLRWFRRIDGRLYAWYLLYDFGYAASARGDWPPELAVRLGDFEAQIRAALQSGDWDEVLVVGHSTGASLAIAVTAGVVRQGVPAGAGPLSLLTLGHTVPVHSFLPRARALRRDLRLLSESEAIFWLDVSAPGDGGSFALADPVAVSGVAGPGQRWPIVISAAFRQTMDPQKLAQIRKAWNFFRLHVQYLCAFERPGDYDYFRITAGPRTLAQRFAGRRHSPQRITRALSPHWEMAP
jgi:hypothetical protein